MTNYEFHEYANLFPMMNEEQFTSLVDSVSIGFNEKHPITLYEGKILDGRNRYLACLKAEVTPIFKEFVGDSDAALRFVRIENLERNHYNEAQRAMVGAKLKSVFEEQAKQRQVEAAKVGGGKTSEDFYEKTVTKVENKVKVNLPFQESGQSRDKAADAVGVSGKSVDFASKVIEKGAPELVKAVEQGKIAVSTAAAITQLPKDEQKRVVETKDAKVIVAAAKEANEIKKVEKAQPRKSEYILLDDYMKLSDEEKRLALMPIKSNSGFNKQSDESIDWAKWSWNPITGCKHECPYCYANDIAIRFYPQKFAPSFYAERLLAPSQVKVPDTAKNDISFKNVFTCSMADLFGRWVPSEWIEAVLEQVRNNPQWNFLFLTKFPKRLIEFEFPVNAWMGTTVDCQARVKAAEDAFEKISGGTKWLSIEPLLQPLKFTRLELFDWMAIGGSSPSTQSPPTPEWKPPFDWIIDLHIQAKQANCKVYHKSNMYERVKQFPWVESSEKKLPDCFKYIQSLKD